MKSGEALKRDVLNGHIIEDIVLVPRKLRPRSLSKWRILMDSKFAVNVVANHL